MIEIGRHYNIPKDNRFCVYCEGEVEDELHFLLICPLYGDLREKYIDHNYTRLPNQYSFYNIMSSNQENVIRNLAMFKYYSFSRRKSYIEEQEQ